MGHSNSFFLDLVTLIHRNSQGGNLQVMYCVQQNMAQQYPFFLMYSCIEPSSVRQPLYVLSPRVVDGPFKTGGRPIQRKKLHQASGGTRQKKTAHCSMKEAARGTYASCKASIRGWHYYSGPYPNLPPLEGLYEG